MSSVRELSPEGVFRIHPKIRWAGLATDLGEVLFSQMRPGVESLSPPETDRSFMQLGPLLLSGVCERLAPWAGSLELIIIQYQKVVMFVTRLGRHNLALTLDKADAEAMPEVKKSLLSVHV